MPYRIVFLLLFVFSGFYAAMVNAAQIELNIADIVSPAFSARAIRVTLLPDSSADLHIAELHIAEKNWQKVHLHCTELSLSTAKLVCRKGRLDAAPDLPFTVSYEFASQQLELRLAAGRNELWQLHADFQSRPWRINSSLRNAQVFRVAALLPEGLPLPSKGTLNGSLELLGNKQGVSSISAEVQLSGLAFSDSSGLRAGEKLYATLNLHATRQAQQWDSHVALDWHSGELFWQPLYLHGGHTLQANLQWDGTQIKISQLAADLDGVGKIELNALWDVTAKQLVEADVSGMKLGLARLYADYARPFLAGSTLAGSEMSGSSDFSLKFSKGAIQELKLGLHEAGIVDGQKRFALYGLNADIPWSAEQTSGARLSFNSGAVWGVPLGATELQMTLRGLDFALADAALPVLDGKLSVHDFHLQQEQDGWRWEFSGGLTPLSMSPLSLALGWPEMQGTLSGMIPHVSYQEKMLKVDGALLFRVFDGSVVVTGLKLFDPFGPAPRLYGNLDMRELDLGVLTQAFSFGNIQGRIDVSVQELELLDWQPVRFDARVASSPGSYRKKISQKAVQNISALGGAGPAAAVQRSVMSVFENFGYSRIVLSCVLHNGVCAMDGEGSDANNYYIVKGGGIPAINVMGYNHRVDWNELLTRLKRVITSNRKVVVE
jgi:hypothetical protein